jgi:UDP-N-acetylmuramyl pentapeptide phosphotransferase/UDP-N-acetylglucosamine-1-phosphate transferase
MDTAVIDFPALAIGFTISLVVTVALSRAERGGDRRRGWIVAGALAALLIAIGLVDLLRETPRQTHVATVLVGVPLPILGALGVIRATRRVRPALRWTVVFSTTFVLLFGGLLIGAAVVPRWLR